MARYAAVISSHNNSHLSGVAKFNHILAEYLRAPCGAFDEYRELAKGPVLLSLKVRDCNEREVGLLSQLHAHFLKRRIAYDLFFHAFDGLDIEYDLLEECRKAYCGNSEIYHAIQGLDVERVQAWCPALVDPNRKLREASLNIFSFGMAHKIQVEYYRILEKMLRSHADDYSIWVSTAFHEKANFGDFDSVSNQLKDIFGRRITLLGFLSDEAVNFFLMKAQVFIAFFEKGVRSNNTSVYAAMSMGCPVLTNIDEYSPRWMKHGENILDIGRLRHGDLGCARLKALGARSRKDVRKYAGWKPLTALMNS